MRRPESSAAHESRTLPMQGPEATERLADARLVLGRYRLERRLGAGGFGVVWRAWDEKLEREVAVKVIPIEQGSGERAEREARAAARLNHPGIVAVYELASDEHEVYLVSELVRGRTLAELLQAGAVADRDVARIGAVLCDALEHAHARGVIHRDVKPQNVMVVAEPAVGVGFAKLADFGVAHLTSGERLTHTGDVVGTLAYMAPEQAEGAARDPGERRVLAGPHPLRGLDGDQSRARRAAWPPLRAGSATRYPRSPAAAATFRPSSATSWTTRWPWIRRSGRARRSCGRDWSRPSASWTRRAGSRSRPRCSAWASPRLAAAAASAAAGIPRSTPATWRRSPRWPRTCTPTPPPGSACSAAGAVRSGSVRALAGRVASRVFAGVAAGTIVAAALGTLGTDAPQSPLTFGAAAAVATALLPRVGWAASGLVVCAWLATAADRPGTALLVAAAMLAVPLCLPRAGLLWSLPVIAPLLGTIGLGPAFVGLAALAPTPWRRAGLAAAGGAWLMAAEALTGDAYLFGTPDGVPGRAGFEGSATSAAGDVVAQIVTSPMVLTLAAWAILAAVLPYVLRGRWLAADLVAAAAWSIALVASMAAIGDLLGGTAALEQARGAVAGALVGALAAVAVSQTSPPVERWRAQPVTTS